MLKVGLTGGIGCGKTTVANLFISLGIPVLDADVISHQLVAVGQPALLKIADHFGDGILNSDGALNRAQLREIVFANPAQKKQLEAILHPLVYQELQSQMTQLHTPYCLVSVPLLFETNMQHLVDRVLVVDCPVSIQIERVRIRDNISLERVQSILDSQVSRETRLANANEVIDNSNADSALAEQVKKLHNFYLSISDRQDKSVCEQPNHL